MPSEYIRLKIRAYSLQVMIGLLHKEIEAVKWSHDKQRYRRVLMDLTRSYEQHKESRYV